MGLFSPLFRSLDQEIAVLEKRIELRRHLIKSREQDVQRQVVDTLTSPAAFAGAAAVGFMLGRSPRRTAAGKAGRRAGWVGKVGGLALTLLQMRYGSPTLWVARAMAGLAARGRPRQ